MKRKALRNGLMVSALAMTICLSAAIVATSCQKQHFDEDPALLHSKVTEEWPYLDFTDSYTGVGSPSDQDWEIIMEVSKRVQFSKTNGLWEMNIHSAADINVSPQVFTFLIQTIERSNAKVVSRLSVLSTTPRMLKPGGGEGVDDPEKSASDCVASCFGWIHENMGFGPSYDTAQKWINSQYGAGVPVDRMEFTLQHFYGVDHVSSFSVNDQPVNSWHNDGNSIVILDYYPNSTDRTEGHAVIYQGTGNGVHWAIDPSQNSENPAPVIIDFDDVISSFKITK